MAVCIVCGGFGFTLNDGLCPECNGTGKDIFDDDAIIFDEDDEDIRSGEPLVLNSCGEWKPG